MEAVMYDPPAYIWATIFELPLALIVTAGVPVLLVLHITSMSALAKAPRTPLPARKTVQLKIDLLSPVRKAQT
jgi:hypothetical protein